jgi:hypothetical protein
MTAEEINALRVFKSNTVTKIHGPIKAEESWKKNK